MRQRSVSQRLIRLLGIALLCVVATAQNVSTPAAAPAVSVSAVPNPAEPDACSFINTSPRYYRIEADLTLFGGGVDYPAGDALIRALRNELNLDECQLSITTGESCDSGTTNLPCPDPFYQCANGVLISPTLYEVVQNGECNLANGSPLNTLICRALAQDGSIAQAVSSGTCRAACVLGDLANTTAPLPAPSDCISSIVAIKVPTEQQADDIATTLGNNTRLQSITDTMYSFHTPIYDNNNQGGTAGGSATGNTNGGAKPNRGPNGSSGAVAGQENGGDFFAYTSNEDGDGGSDGNGGTGTSAGAGAGGGAGGNENGNGSALGGAGAPGANNTSNGSTNQTMSMNLVHAEIKPVVGFGSFPPPPSPPPPPPPLAELEEPPEYVSTKSTDTDTPTVNGSSLVVGQWSTCYPHCGQGWSTRSAICISPVGAVLASTQCPDRTDTSLSKQCEFKCGEAHYMYGTWSPCSATCGSGVSKRSVECIPGSDGSQCTGDVGATEMQCNTAPCEVFLWRVSDLGDCTAPCGGGTRTRSVMCVDGSGKQVDDSKCDSGNKPTTQEACNSKPCDFCSGNICLGRGTCVENACKCDSGYEGDYCESPKSCGSGVIDAMLQCCDSGMVDAQGSCCPKDTSLDAQGQCCSQAVDACGVCGGTGKYMDLQNNCCDVVDANGLCCKSGVLDECGVCDGMGNSCSVDIVMEMGLAPSLVQGSSVLTNPLNDLLANISSNLGLSRNYTSVESIWLGEGPSLVPTTGTRRRRLVQNPVPTAATTGGQVPVYMNLLVSPDLNATTGPPTSAAYLQAAMAMESGLKSPDGQAQLAQIISAGRIGVCGNKICEVGERPITGIQNGTCPDDCTAPLRICEGGCGTRGVCMPSSGVCSCFSGHMGKNCGECTAGYVMASSGFCVASVVDQNLVSPTVIDASGVALVDTAEDEGMSSGTVAGIVIGVLLGIGLLVVLLVLVVKKCKSRPKKRQFDLEDGHTLYSENGTEVSLRQKYSRRGGETNAGPSNTDGISFFNPTFNNNPGRYNSTPRQFDIHVDAGLGHFAPTQRAMEADADVAPLRRVHSMNDTATPAGNTMAVSMAVDMQGVQCGNGNPEGVGAWVRQGGHYRRHSADEAGVLNVTNPLASAADMQQQQGQQQQQGGVRPFSGHSLTESDIGGPYPADSPELGAEMGQGAGAGVDYGGATHRRLLTSYTGTKLDPEARLYFNPAYSMEGKPALPSSSIASEFHIPKPVPVKMPLSAREARQAIKQEEPQRTRPLSARAAVASDAVAGGDGSNKGVPGGTVAERKAKLEALRAAVNALEEESGQRPAKKRVSFPTVATFSPKKSPTKARPTAPTAAPAPRPTKGGAPLQNRPAVPRLQLNQANSVKPSHMPTRMGAPLPGAVKPGAAKPTSKPKPIHSTFTAPAAATAAASSSASGSASGVSRKESGFIKAVHSTPEKLRVDLGGNLAEIKGARAKTPLGARNTSTTNNDNLRNYTSAEPSGAAKVLNLDPAADAPVTTSSPLFDATQPQQQPENKADVPKADPRYSMVMNLVNGALKGPDSPAKAKKQAAAEGASPWKKMGQWLSPSKALQGLRRG